MDHLMQVVCQAGKMLLESGAETYRVEETMVRICRAFGVVEAESFVLPTGIFLSIVSDGEVKTKVVRIKKRAVNLQRIDEINALSRQAANGQIDLEDFERHLNEVARANPLSMRMILLAAALSGGAFAFFFQGNLQDAVVATICSMAVKYVVMKLEQFGIINLISNCVGGAVVTLLALLITSLGCGEHLQIIISSGIMLLVPGVAFTNAIYDSFAGDLVSGMAKMAEAIIIAVSIALGTGAMLGLWLLVGGWIA